MSKTICFEYEGKEYELKFTAMSLRKLERKGVNIMKMEDNLLSAPTEMFCMAFEANHPDVPMEKREELFDLMCGSIEEDKLVDTLMEMLGEAVQSITNPKGKIMWKIR